MEKNRQCANSFDCDCKRYRVIVGFANLDTRSRLKRFFRIRFRTRVQQPSGLFLTQCYGNGKSNTWILLRVFWTRCLILRLPGCESNPLASVHFIRVTVFLFTSPNCAPSCLPHIKQQVGTIFIKREV